MTYFAITLPGWNSLEAVRSIHSDFEGAALVFFALLVASEALAHLSDEEKREKLFDRISVVLFAVAVLAEIVAYPYGQRNDTLSGRIIGSLDVESKEALSDSGTALSQARGAEARSSFALEKANAAASSASNAFFLARGARKEADTFEFDIVTAKKQAADAESRLANAVQRTARLEKQLSWRTITPEQVRSIKDFLAPSWSGPSSPFRGVKINLSYLSGDAEGGEYSEELAAALRNALGGSGAEIGEPTSVVIVGLGVPPRGLIIETRRRDSPAAGLLQHALKAAGIYAPGQVTAVPNGDIDLLIGVRETSTKERSIR
jgi:hypothetical protein